MHREDEAGSGELSESQEGASKEAESLHQDGRAHTRFYADKLRSKSSGRGIIFSDRIIQRRIRILHNQRRVRASVETKDQEPEFLEPPGTWTNDDRMLHC